MFRKKRFIQGSILHHFLEVAKIRYAGARDSFLPAHTGTPLEITHEESLQTQPSVPAVGRKGCLRPTSTYRVTSRRCRRFISYSLSKDPFLSDTRGRRFSPAVLQAPRQQLLPPKPTPREQADLFRAYHPLPALVKRVVVHDYPHPMPTITSNAISMDF